ncbi:hypothetical protein [Micromonospora sp. KC721]|uniref:hypothetical protein n=1 Tax=Micromonospora sp. KC721 TaxID=2530380 RepID=UPI001043C15C|nr:hypothetical protein [Micromonospora sp. KC721]TDB81491.1 hypothetical protein E1182_05150 [Micromonospora sp. KC721]
MAARMMRPAHPVPGPIVARRVVGTPGEVAAVVATLRDSNRLVGMSLPAQMPHDDGRVWVTVRFIDRPRAARAAVPARAVRRWPVVTAVAVPAATVVAVAGYLAVQLVTALIALLPLLAGGAFVLAVLALLLRRSGVCCPGLRCPGCNH